MNERLKETVRSFLPRTLKRHRILAGPLKGSSIVTSWHDYPAAILGRTEAPLLQYFGNHVRAGETWLDIGAHYGYTAIALCKLVGTRGRVFAFEPMLNTSGCISRMRSINGLQQLTVIPMGLANSEGVSIAKLNSIRGMIDSTLQDLTGFKETFVASSLDWLWPRIAGENAEVHGIKIDVQGMELQVLEGMAVTARKYCPKLLLEIHKGVSRPKLLELLMSYGYGPHGIAVEPLPGETQPMYFDDRTYLFTVDSKD